MKTLVLAIFVFTIMLASVSKAAESQQWTSLNLSSRLNDDFSLVTEIINRYSSEKSEFVTRSNRIGLSFKIGDSLTYTFLLENRDTNSDSNDEIRFINQLQKKWSFDFASLSARLRLESREFSNTPVYALRARGLVKAELKTLKIGEVVPFLAYEHLYVCNDTVGRPQGSSERRNQIGAAFPVDLISASFELSYMDRIVIRPETSQLSEQVNTYSIVNLASRWAF